MIVLGPSEISINDGDFEKYRASRTEEFDSSGYNITSVRYEYHFPNGYGASILKNMWTGHKWELAVLIRCDDNWHICYDTDITDDVISYLTDSMVTSLLSKIICLPKIC